jgi:hypothetical protein
MNPTVELSSHAMRPTTPPRFDAQARTGAGCCLLCNPSLRPPSVTVVTREGESLRAPAVEGGGEIGDGIVTFAAASAARDSVEPVQRIPVQDVDPLAAEPDHS